MFEGGTADETPPEPEDGNVFRRAYDAGIIAVSYGIVDENFVSRWRRQQDARATHITPDGEGEYGEF